MKVNNLLKENKKLSILLITAVIIIILGLGGITYKYMTGGNQNSTSFSKEDLLVTENKFALKDVKFDTEEKTKQVKVGYNEKNHNVKIKMETKKEDDHYKIEYKIYIDDEYVHSVSGGSGYPENNMINEGFDGYIYVIDSKYLGIVLPEVSLFTHPGYKLTFYNDKTKAGDDILVKSPGNTLCEDKECNKIINNIEDIEFNGKTIKYWWQECLQEANVKYEVKFDGKNVTKEQIEKANNMYDNGVVGC